MKLKSYILGLSTVFMTLLAPGCINETLNADLENCGPGGNPSDADMYYMALRIYNAAAIDASTRADSDGPIYDSDGNKDIESTDDKKFNIGRAGENAIYAPSSEADCPNFMLVFGESETPSSSSRLEYLMPLYDWDFENEGEDKKDPGESPVPSGYNSYYTFYTSAKKIDLPSSFDNRKILVVLNASDALKTYLKNSLSNGATYDKIINTKLSQAVKKDTDYIYFEDSKGTQYFTMSSSMVIPKSEMTLPTGATMMTPVGEYGPSVIKRPMVWKRSKEEAVKTPVFSFFLERVQSKYTLTVKHNDIKYYFSKDSKIEENHEYQPVTSLTIWSDELPNLKPEWQTIQYVSNYNRRNEDTDYDPDYVKTFIKTAENGFKINFTGWGINGIEREEYLFKQVSSDGNYYSNWNPEPYSPYRNFWAVDPNYSGTEYPDQYREAKKLTFGSKDSQKPEGAIDWLDSWAKIERDKTVSFWKEEYETNEKYLDYFPANSMRNWTPHLYSPENTLSTNVFSKYETNADAFAGRAYMRAGSHIILTAQLLIDGMEPAGLFENPTFNENHMAQTSSGQTVVSKYYMNGLFWSPDAYKEYVGEYLGYWMMQDEKNFGHNDGIFYTEANPDRSQPTYAKAEHFFIEPLMIEGSDGWAHVIPLLSALVTEDKISKPEVKNKFKNGGLAALTDEEIEEIPLFYTYNSDTNEYNLDKPVTLKKFEVLALSHPEYFARHFNLGRMYYAIPIVHYVKIDDKANSELIYLGKYGAVRNHWYNYTITEIKDLGAPIDDPTADLIIPNNDHSFESLGVTLSILPWHIVEEDVDITDQRQPARPDQIDVDLYFKADDWYYDGKEFEY